MPQKELNILVIDDFPGHYGLIRIASKRAAQQLRINVNIEFIATQEQAVPTLLEAKYDALFCDTHLNPGYGPNLCDTLVNEVPYLNRDSIFGHSIDPDMRSEWESLKFRFEVDRTGIKNQNYHEQIYREILSRE